MRTIKTYSKGAPFYNASPYRNLAFGRFPVTENPVSQDLVLSARHDYGPTFILPVRTGP
jgi:hypothetical protein